MSNGRTARRRGRWIAIACCAAWIPTARCAALIATARWAVLVAAGCAGLIAAAGCEDVSLNVERGAPRRVRPAPRPIASAKDADAAGRPIARATDAGVAVRKGAAARMGEGCEVADGAGPCYQRVLLLSEPLPADDPAGLRCVRLARANARDVGRLLSWMYSPCGPAGSRTRYCLVYPSAREADAAARLAAELDVAPAGSDDGRAVKAGLEAWALGVGLLYGGGGLEDLDPPRIRRVEASLAKVLTDQEIPAIRRWAAGMLCGRVVAGYGRDYAAAERYFAAAEEQAVAGSLEQAAAWLARAGNHIQNGESRAAREILARIIEGERFRDTEVFDRAGRALRELDRR